MPITNQQTPEELAKITEEALNAPDDTQDDSGDKYNIDLQEVENMPDPDPEPAPEPTADPETTPEPEVEQDYETKFKQSTKEATTLHFRNKQMKDAVNDAKTIGEPTDDEIRDYAKQLGEDFDSLDNFTKNLLKRNLVNEQKFDKVSNVIEDKEELDNWVGDVSEYVNDEKILNKYPSLANRSTEFIRFSSKKSRRGMDMEDLVAAFMYSEVQGTPKKKGSLLLNRGGGQDPMPQKKGFDADDLQALRNKDPKKYMEAVKSGKVDIKL